MSDVKHFADRFTTLAGNVETFIRGKPEVVRLALVCLFAQGHLLIEDVPGVAKTSLAKAIARSISGVKLRRIQFTPDLLPSDVIGVQTYDQANHVFKFIEGPVFANIVIGDEINRASPKTQSALLEVMAEQQVTIDGLPRPVPDPFLCIATQNPIEHQGTYALPEAQLDRFMMRIEVGYPSDPLEEMQVITNGIARRTPERLLEPVMQVDDLRGLIKVAQSVHVSDPIKNYIVQVAMRTRGHDSVRLGISPRGCIALAAAAQAYAAAQGQDFVVTDDVRAVALPVLSHRVLLKPEARMHGANVETILNGLLRDAEGVPAPRKRWA
ncbi:MoxR family ATPase [Lentzea sp. BCCO 10_0856]|uniref:MoxR family ATPase n=1 Tax=Lentzea miocenica TaxID=3095431 RepID=A0ABU4SVZ0_9PSEU|nr:MoxR family ATPase [Lentzea sp. BCCO 10_0856]MDX8029952.1 MoxR family ATPase [Lentzea sp. BCCO 10_0856]